MMNGPLYIVYDTETTGLVDKYISPHHPKQPHLVQLAAILTDGAGEELASLSVIIRPDGFEIPKGASDVHGITTGKALRCGVPLAAAMALFDGLYSAAQFAVAHNNEFDDIVLQTAYGRARVAAQRHEVEKVHLCTMRAATPILNLPPTDRMRAAGFNKPKPPRLEECIQHFFGEKLEGAHDALVDVRACKRVFFYLKEKGHI